MARVLIISLLLYSLNFFLGLANVFGNPGRNGHVFVKKVKLAGNLILDDIAFKKSLDMGSGIYLTHDLMSLITNEIEGFYSSHGFHQVFVDYPFRKPRKGILTVDVDERKEIMEGQSEIQRAEIAIDRLLRESRLDSSVVSKKNAVSTLVGAYKAERTKNLQLEEKRKNKEKLLAQIQRNQYLAFLEKKSATEAEDLKFRRESLQAAFANQEKFINEQQKEDARRLVKMRQRMRTILDTNFKSQ